MSRAALVVLGAMLLAFPAGWCFSGNISESGFAVVVIDPGHPSETSAGTEAADGTRENDVNWDVAVALQEYLKSVPNLRILSTKTHRNERVTNRRRAEIANEAGAVLLLRLHCDSGRKRGFTLYYPDRSGKTAEGDSGPSPEICRQSASAAIILHAALRQGAVEFFSDNGILTDRETYVGSRQGALTGSIFSQVPVVTVEMLYMSSAEDMAAYHSPAGRAALVTSLAKGIRDFLAQR